MTPQVSPSFGIKDPRSSKKVEEPVFDMAVDLEPFKDYILLEQQEFIMVDCGESTDTDGYDESLFKEEYGSHLYNANY